MSGRKRSQQDVELNVASMLDMAFPLLAFFILTFSRPRWKARLVCGCPRRNRPPTRTARASPAIRTARSNPSASIRSPSRSSPRETATSISTGTGPAWAANRWRALPNSARGCRASSRNPDSPFEQLVVQSSPKLRYGELMQVVNVCTRKDSPTAKNWTSLVSPSFPRPTTMNNGT